MVDKSITDGLNVSLHIKDLFPSDGVKVQITGDDLSITSDQTSSSGFASDEMKSSFHKSQGSKPIDIVLTQEASLISMISLDSSSNLRCDHDQDQENPALVTAEDYLPQVEAVDISKSSKQSKNDADDNHSALSQAIDSNHESPSKLVRRSSGSRRRRLSTSVLRADFQVLDLSTKSLEASYSFIANSKTSDSATLESQLRPQRNTRRCSLGTCYSTHQSSDSGGKTSDHSSHHKMRRRCSLDNCPCYSGPSKKESHSIITSEISNRFQRRQIMRRSVSMAKLGTTSNNIAQQVSKDILSSSAHDESSYRRYMSSHRSRRSSLDTHSSSEGQSLIMPEISFPPNRIRRPSLGRSNISNSVLPMKSNDGQTRRETSRLSTQDQLSIERAIAHRPQRMTRSSNDTWSNFNEKSSTVPDESFDNHQAPSAPSLERTMALSILKTNRDDEQHKRETTDSSAKKWSSREYKTASCHQYVRRSSLDISSSFYSQSSIVRAASSGSKKTLCRPSLEKSKSLAKLETKMDDEPESGIVETSAKNSSISESKSSPRHQRVRRSSIHTCSSFYSPSSIVRAASFGPQKALCRPSLERSKSLATLETKMDDEPESGIIESSAKNWSISESKTTPCHQRVRRSSIDTCSSFYSPSSIVRAASFGPKKSLCRPSLERSKSLAALETKIDDADEKERVESSTKNWSISESKTAPCHQRGGRNTIDTCSSPNGQSSIVPAQLFAHQKTFGKPSLKKSTSSRALTKKDDENRKHSDSSCFSRQYQSSMEGMTSEQPQRMRGGSLDSCSSTEKKSSTMLDVSFGPQQNHKRPSFLRSKSLAALLPNRHDDESCKTSLPRSHRIRRSSLDCASSAEYQSCMKPEISFPPKRIYRRPSFGRSKSIASLLSGNDSEESCKISNLLSLQRHPAHQLHLGGKGLEPMTLKEEISLREEDLHKERTFRSKDWKEEKTLKEADLVESEPASAKSTLVVLDKERSLRLEDLKKERPLRLERAKSLRLVDLKKEKSLKLVDLQEGESKSASTIMKSSMASKRILQRSSGFRRSLICHSSLPLDLRDPSESSFDSLNCSSVCGKSTSALEPNTSFRLQRIRRPTLQRNSTVTVPVPVLKSARSDSVRHKKRSTSMSSLSQKNEALDDELTYVAPPTSLARSTSLPGIAMQPLTPLVTQKTLHNSLSVPCDIRDMPVSSLDPYSSIDKKNSSWVSNSDQSSSSYLQGVPREPIFGRSASVASLIGESDCGQQQLQAPPHTTTSKPLFGRSPPRTSLTAENDEQQLLEQQVTVSIKPLFGRRVSKASLLDENDAGQQLLVSHSTIPKEPLFGVCTTITPLTAEKDFGQELPTPPLTLPKPLFGRSKSMTPLIAENDCRQEPPPIFSTSTRKPLFGRSITMAPSITVSESGQQLLESTFEGIMHSGYSEVEDAVGLKPPSFQRSRSLPLTGLVQRSGSRRSLISKSSIPIDLRDSSLSSIDTFSSTYKKSSGASEPSFCPHQIRGRPVLHRSTSVSALTTRKQCANSYQGITMFHKKGGNCCDSLPDRRSLLRKARSSGSILESSSSDASALRTTQPMPLPQRLLQRSSGSRRSLVSNLSMPSDLLLADESENLEPPSLLQSNSLTLKAVVKSNFGCYETSSADSTDSSGKKHTMSNFVGRSIFDKPASLGNNGSYKTTKSADDLEYRQNEDQESSLSFTKIKCPPDSTIYQFACGSGTCNGSRANILISVCSCHPIYQFISSLGIDVSKLSACGEDCVETKKVEKIEMVSSGIKKIHQSTKHTEGEQNTDILLRKAEFPAGTSTEDAEVKKNATVSSVAKATAKNVTLTTTGRSSQVENDNDVSSAETEDSKKCKKMDKFEGPLIISNGTEKVSRGEKVLGPSYVPNSPDNKAICVKNQESDCCSGFGKEVRIKNDERLMIDKRNGFRKSFSVPGGKCGQLQVQVDVNNIKTEPLSLHLDSSLSTSVQKNTITRGLNKKKNSLRRLFDKVFLRKGGVRDNRERQFDRKKNICLLDNMGKNGNSKAKKRIKHSEANDLLLGVKLNTVAYNSAFGIECQGTERVEENQEQIRKGVTDDGVRRKLSERGRRHKLLFQRSNSRSKSMNITKSAAAPSSMIENREPKNNKKHWDRLRQKRERIKRNLKKKSGIEISLPSPLASLMQEPQYLDSYLEEGSRTKGELEDVHNSSSILSYPTGNISCTSNYEAYLNDILLLDSESAHRKRLQEKRKEIRRSLRVQACNSLEASSDSKDCINDEL